MNPVANQEEVGVSQIKLSVGDDPSTSATPSSNGVSPQSLMAQSDRFGNQTQAAAPVYDLENPKTTEMRESYFFGVFSCCFRSPRQREVQLRPSSVSSNNLRQMLANRPARWGMPAKMPVMLENDSTRTGKYCLVLDLDETLVHSSFTPISNADYIIPVNIDGVVHNVFVLKRPGVDEFMRRVGEHFEIVIYTASLSKYADPLLDQLDIHNVIDKRLFREHCVFHEGYFVKDLSLLNRSIKKSIIVDNSPMSYKFQPENAIDCSSFIDDPKDIEMWQIADFLINIKSVDDVRKHCRSWREWCKSNPSQILSK